MTRPRPTPRGRVLTLLSVIACSVATSGSVSADGAAGVAKYQEGRKLLADGKASEALVALDASLAALPSPNTKLLRAHALRELGRMGAAMEAYQAVEKEAGERVGAGEARYRATAEEAARWIALLRTQLGQLEITTHGAPPDATLSIGGVGVALNGGGASAWQRSGPTVVVLRSPDGREKSVDVEVIAGEVTRVALALPAVATESTAAIAEVEPSDDGADGLPWPPWPAWIPGGIGVVGFAFFAGFGAASASTASDLDACSPACPDDLREDADAAAQSQTIANVSLVVGATGLAAFGTIWVLDVLLEDGILGADDDALALSPSGIAVRF
jgi:hypothetical protein